MNVLKKLKSWEGFLFVVLALIIIVNTILTPQFLTFSNQIDEAVTTYEMMRDTAILLKTEEMRVSAMNKLALLYGTRQGDLQRAVETLEESEKYAIFCGDVAGQAERHMTNCFIQTTLGEFDEARAVRLVGELCCARRVLEGSPRLLVAGAQGLELGVQRGRARCLLLDARRQGRAGER